MDYLETAVLCAKEGGKAAMEGFGKEKQISRKSPEQLATEFDLLAEKRIRAIIRRRYPGHGIYGEEMGKEGGNGYVWLVDPIDGTHNFIRDIPLFATSVALAKEGKVLCGAIYAPALKELFQAEKGTGAYMNGRRIRCSATKDTRDCMLLYGTNTRRFPDMASAFLPIGRMVRYIRMFGSAAIYLSYAACGRADAVIDFGIKPYDIAAGCLIAEEAGCLITDFSGKPWSAESDRIICANKSLHSKILSMAGESICRQ